MVSRFSPLPEAVASPSAGSSATRGAITTSDSTSATADTTSVGGTWSFPTLLRSSRSTMLNLEKEVAAASSSGRAASSKSGSQSLRKLLLMPRSRCIETGNASQVARWSVLLS